MGPGPGVGGEVTAGGNDGRGVNGFLAPIA